MNHRKSSRFFLVCLAFAVGAGGLLVPDPASAAKQLFRVERKFFGAPFPSVPGYGGAGRYENYIEPYTFASPPASATVQGNCAAYSPLGIGCISFTAGANPVGSPFTLPKGFITFQGTFTNYASTAFPGYTSVSAVDYYNGLGRFGPNNGATAATRVVFPTTMGNPTPNLGNGAPVTPTTTFGGRYDFDRAGTLNVTPGPNRFGGTMRLLYRPTSLFYQYIFYFSPVIFKAYGSFTCRRGGTPGGTPCTGGSLTDTLIGSLTSTGMVTRFVLNDARTKKATTPTNGNYVFAKNYYLHLLHPWTTGVASDYNYRSTFLIRPKLTGYDQSLGGANITVTHTYTGAQYKGTGTMGKVYYTYYTYKQYLNDVRRVVSLVRPRIIHTYENPVGTDPIFSNFQAARMWTMRVFFLPEPGAMLMLGAGVLSLAGLAFFRRR